MGTVSIGPWPAGIDMMSEVTSLTKGAVVDAVNGVIVRGGTFVRRDGESLVVADELHSLWKNGSTTYAMQGNVLGTTDITNGTANFTPIAALSSAMPVSYDTLLDGIVLGNNDGLYTLTDVGLQPLGVEMPGAFKASASTVGGLNYGHYAVAISYISETGEESGLSAIQFVTVDTGGGIWFDLPKPIESTVKNIRLYRSTGDGDVLFAAATVPASLSGYHIGVDQGLYQAADNQFLARMPGGRYVMSWQGRLLVARGRTLYFSEPMRYGLHNAATGFIQMPYEICFIGGFSTGIFVGTPQGTYFLDGSKPADWKMVLVDGEAPLAGGCLLLNIESFTDEEELFPAGTDYVITWLGCGGFHFGLPSGTVIRPQNNRVSLDLIGATGSIQLVGDVLTAIVF